MWSGFTLVNLFYNTLFNWTRFLEKLLYKHMLIIIIIAIIIIQN